ncbi:Methionine gamma-lyase [Zea mays]|uniref:Methionine gamma-lyase n=1 Tax=Zea mays TaxID=4577 RepID=A0A1D6GMP1_MAIZE|nr:Methionine gamma-lyase [Zea mays]
MSIEASATFTVMEPETMRHAVRRHGHGGARQPPHAPPPEHHPVRPHGRQPGLLRDARVLLRDQHQQRDAAPGPRARRHLPGPRPHVRGLQRHAGAALGTVGARASAHAAAATAAAPPPQGRCRPRWPRRRQQPRQTLTLGLPSVHARCGFVSCSWIYY